MNSWRPVRDSDAPLRDLDALDETRLSLRCGACGTLFEAADTGADPLVAACPACGVEGILPRESPRPVEDAARPPLPETPTGSDAPRRLRVRCPRCGAQTDVSPEPEAGPQLRVRCEGCQALLGVRNPSVRH